MSLQMTERAEVASTRQRRLLRDGLQTRYEILLRGVGWPSTDATGLHTLGITSAAPREGVSTVAAHLAAVAAQTTSREVLLIDANFQAPSQHERFGVALKPGFAELLQSGGDLPTAIHATLVDGLSVLPAGKPSGAASRIHDVFELAAAIKELSADFDLVVVDMPPAGQTALSLRLASVLDGVLLVVEAQRTRSALVERAVEMLRRSHSRVLGSVLNKSRESGRRAAE